jgi:Peptidase family M23
MKIIAALPVLIAFLVGALPAHAWTWPVAGPVLQPFQLGSDPYVPGQHRGIDVGAPPGTTVLAPTNGVVSFAGTVPRGGRTITIATPDGYAVTLVHLGSVAVARGAAVEEGVAVGTIGPSGDAEHAEGYVHLGIRVASEPHGYVDPESLLPSAPASGDAEVPDPAETPSQDEPAEAPEQEAEAPAEPGGVAEPEPPSPDPGGEAELPAEQVPEQIPDDPPAEGAQQPEPSGSTSVPVELPAETGYPQPNADRVTEELPAVPPLAAKADAGSPATHLDKHLPAESVGGEAQWAPGSTLTPGPGSPARPEPASQEAQSARAGSRVAADPPPVEPAGRAGRPTTGDHPVGVLGTGMLAAAALVAGVLAFVLVRIGVRVLPTPAGDGDPSTIAAHAEADARTVREDASASADVDLWLAELLSPRVPCPSRVVRAGRRSGACRRLSPGRAVTRSRVAQGRGERSARAGRVRPELRSRS